MVRLPGFKSSDDEAWDRDSSEFQKAMQAHAEPAPRPALEHEAGQQLLGTIGAALTSLAQPTEKPEPDRTSRDLLEGWTTRP